MRKIKLKETELQNIISRVISEKSRREMEEGVHSPYGEKKDQWGSNKDEYARYMRGGVKHKAGVVGGKKYGKGGHYKTYINKKGRNAKLKYAKDASKHITMKESDLIRLVRKTVNESSLLIEQQGTPWCQACGQTYAMNNPQSHCHSSSSKPCHPSFNLNSVSCQSCKNYMVHPYGSPANEAANIVQYCNQVGQPCHTTTTPYVSPGKGWAQADQTPKARKGDVGGDDGTVKLKESQLTNIIDKITRRYR